MDKPRTNKEFDKANVGRPNKIKQNQMNQKSNKNP